MLGRAIERFDQNCFRPIKMLIKVFHRQISQSYCDFNYDLHHLFDSDLRPENLVQFFVNFLIWCVAFTAYVLATLLPIVVITGNSTVAGGDLIDGQVVGVMGA